MELQLQLQLQLTNCYRKIFNVTSNENVRLCLDVFKCDDVDTLLAKRKQKFVGSLVRMDSLFCELVAVLSDLRLLLLILFVLLR